MCLGFLDKYRDHGLLTLRVGIGAMFMHHGFGKLQAGPEVWTKLGGALGLLGITFAPQFFGLMAALSEFAGGLCLILGLCVRPASIFLFFTMAVAANMHLVKGDGLKVASHAIELGIVFFSLILTGPGKFTLMNKFCSRKK